MKCVLLLSCMQAVDDQFSKEGYVMWKNSIKRLNFKEDKKCIQAKLQGNVENGWVAFLNSADENGFHVSSN